MKSKAILEILVDRQNEKGAGAFEHILIILHKILEKKPKKLFKKNSYFRPEFSFEIAKIGNKIRFFVVCNSKYKEFIKNQIYAHYSNIEIFEVKDYLENIPNDKMVVGEVGLEKHHYYQVKNFVEIQETGTGDTIDPYSSITASLSKTGNNTLNVFQINFSPLPDEMWKKNSDRIIKILTSHYPKFLKKILLNYNFSWLKILALPFYLIFKFFGLLLPKHHQEEEKHDEKHEEEPEKNEIFKNKLNAYGYGVNINVVSASEMEVQNKANLKEIVSTLGVFSFPGVNGFRLTNISTDLILIDKVKHRICNDKIILNTKELSGLVHFPTTYVKTPSINWVLARNFEPPSNLQIVENDVIPVPHTGHKPRAGISSKIEQIKLTNDSKDISKYSDELMDSWSGQEGQYSDLTPIGETNFRGENISFGIGPNDRRRHMYIIGKTGMGKSTLLENMILDDIKKGRGVAIIDPHGDLAEAIIGNIPKSRTNQTIIFDPSDTSWPIAFNMLDDVSPEHRPLIASGLVGIFKKIFGDSWGPRLEHTLRNTILALLEVKDSTLLSIPLMLTNDYFRYKVVSKIKDPVVKKFWELEFNKMAPNQRLETAGPILNKVGQFLSSSILRNILGQPKNSFDIRWAMDNKKIIIINLSKGKIGEDASSLLGAMMVTKFQIDAMSRADILERDRTDFYLYVDEFQNFATDSFATILSEARKYKLNLVMANQYIDQMTETVRGAVFGNVGSLVSFQVGYHDASIMKEVFGNDITVDDLTNLKKYSIYSKILIDGMPSKLFSANTFPPIGTDLEVFDIRYKKILQVSREKYAKPRILVEEKIYKTLEEYSENKEEDKKIEKKKVEVKKVKK